MMLFTRDSFGRMGAAESISKRPRSPAALITEASARRRFYCDRLDREGHPTLVVEKSRHVPSLSENSYRFVHDRVQEAAYSLVPEDQRPLAHLRIGGLLVRQSESDQPEEGATGQHT